MHRRSMIPHTQIPLSESTLLNDAPYAPDERTVLHVFLTNLLTEELCAQNGGRHRKS